MIKQLVFPRFLAAFLVLIFHFFANNPDHSPIAKTVFYPLLNTGDLAVVFFFTLSGFILSYVYLSNVNQLGLRQFYVLRLARIYPAYVLSVLLYLIIGPVYNENYVKWDTFLLNIFMVQSWAPNQVGLLNLAAWSISVEMFFYLLFPFLLKCIKRINLNALGLILMGVGSWIAYYTAVLPISQRMNLPAGIRYLPVFIIGVIAGFVFNKLSNPFPNLYFKEFTMHGTVLAIASILILYVSSVFFFRVNSVNDAVAVLLFTMLVLVLAWDKSFISRGMSSKFLLLLGEISYGIYILQFPVRFWFGEIWRLLGLKQDEFIISLSFVPFLIVIAYSSFKFIEMPIRVIVKRYFATKTV